jgi:hypothetical protein
MNCKSQWNDSAFILPVAMLIIIGGPWAKSESSIPKRSTWNVVAPDGTVVRVIESSQNRVRVAVERLSSRIKENIRIERKVTDKDAERRSVNLEVSVEPEGSFHVEVYRHHAPWNTLGDRKSLSPQSSSQRVEVPVSPGMVRMDGALLLLFEPKEGIIDIQDISDEPNSAL